MRTSAGVALVAAVVAASIGLAWSRRGRVEGARCGPGFLAHGAHCEVPPGACPAPLVTTLGGAAPACGPPDVRVLVPSSVIALGPSDWEAEGRVPARVLRVPAFRLDAFEATRAQVARAMHVEGTGEPLFAASGVTLSEAAAYCAGRGGRLPSEDEWIAAAASAVNPPRRYPWGDTGAVCRRGAWGLQSGPCALGADGPDTVGAHPDGDSPLGLHDLAGNVAEWVARGDGAGAGGVAKGGSWASALAADLRIWARLELPEGARDPRVGVRCAYPP